MVQTKVTDWLEEKGGQKTCHFENLEGKDLLEFLGGKVELY